MNHKSITIHWQGPYPVDKNNLGKGEFEDIFLKRVVYIFLPVRLTEMKK